MFCLCEIISNVTGLLEISDARSSIAVTAYLPFVVNCIVPSVVYYKKGIIQLTEDIGQVLFSSKD
jgi:hypothetical protein